MDKYYLLQDADYLTEVQIDMGDSAEGLQGGVEAIGDLFDFTKSVGESFSSLGGCSGNCKSGSVVSQDSAVLIYDPGGVWVLSISEMLYKLNTQVLVLICMFGLYLVFKIVKPFIDQKLNKNKRPNKSGEKDE